MQQFPIKYLEENLVFNNRTGDVYAYYEWIPYNYSCISEDKAKRIFAEMRNLFSRSRAKKSHLLLINTEESIHDTIGRSKTQVKGELKETACAYLDGVEEQLKRYHGENELAPRFYIGFLLSGEDYELSKKEISIWESVRLGIRDFVQSVNREVFGDYTKMDHQEVERYLKLEKMLYSKIPKVFKVRKVQPKDIAYIIRHLNGQKGVPYESYSYAPDLVVEGDVIKIKTYDVIRLADSVIHGEIRSVDIVTEDRMEKAAYLSLSEMTGENAFPFNSEILYYQQASFDFPVDVSIKVETLENKDALAVIRNKKAELKDLDESAYQSGNRSSNNLYDASGDIDILEAGLERTKENMYKVSYVVRVTGKDDEELAKRVMEVKDYYRNFNMIVQRPLCDQTGLHEECYPSMDRYMDDYIQYVTSDFLAGLGFGAVQQLGDQDGIYIGYNVMTGKSVYIRPELAAQGVEGTVTNALASAYLGSLGGGKSVAANLKALWVVLFGGKSLIIDPKGERKNWKKDFAFLGDALNLIEVAPGEVNRGLFDPFYVVKDYKEAETLALNILVLMTGISWRDGKRFPVLFDHVKKVAEYKDQPKGMLCIIDELRNTGTDVSNSIADHIESFSDLYISSLIFGDGTQKGTLETDKAMNVVLVQKLSLPEYGTAIENFTMSELLSTIILLVISRFSLEFIQQSREIFKLVTLDEAWTWLQVSDGREIAQKLIRTGRSLNAGVDFVTQNCDDLLDEKIKNNIGMKFAFRSRDIREIEKTLTFMDLEVVESNIDALRNLENGECLYKDIKGNCGVIRIDYVYRQFFKAFDTRPPMEVE